MFLHNLDLMINSFTLVSDKNTFLGLSLPNYSAFLYVQFLIFGVKLRKNYATEIKSEN